MAVFSAGGAVLSGQLAGILQSTITPYCYSPRKSLYLQGVGDDEATSDHGACRCSYSLKLSSICPEQQRGFSSSRHVSIHHPLLATGFKCARVSRIKEQNQVTKCVRLASVADEVAVKTLEEDENGSNRLVNIENGELPVLKGPPRLVSNSMNPRNPRSSKAEIVSGAVTDTRASKELSKPVHSLHEMLKKAENLSGDASLRAGPRASAEAEKSVSGAGTRSSSSSRTVERVGKFGAGTGAVAGTGAGTRIGPRSGARVDMGDSLQPLSQMSKKAENLGSDVSSQSGNRPSSPLSARVSGRPNPDRGQSPHTLRRRNNEDEGGRNNSFPNAGKTPATQEQPQANGNNTSDVKPATNSLPVLRPAPPMKPKPVFKPIAPPVAPQAAQTLERKPQMLDRNRRPAEAVPAPGNDPRMLDKNRRPAEAVPLPGSSQQPPVRKQPILKDTGAAPKSRNPVRAPTGSPPQDLAIPQKTKSVEATANIVAPSKPPKVSQLKGKDDWRNKSNEEVDGAKRRGSKMEKGAGTKGADLDGADLGQRGRKYTKARRKAERVEAAKAAEPVRVEILEVGKQGMSISDLAHKLAVNVGDIVKALFLKGIVTTINQILDEETVKLVCKDFEVEVLETVPCQVGDMAKKTMKFDDENDLDSLKVRPPVVTIMGHVDHGKTSLLDYIRKSKVAAGEAGGITQGIGAYRVLVPVGGAEQACVFLDTPGHEAFTAMRARGARVTDIAIIVVAADDGVRPQTTEAIAHAKAANVPIVIAINKVDKEGANPERVMQELSTKGLMPDDWGGDVPMVQVSALTGENVDQLLETVMLVAEFQELKANPSRSARGTVIEASLDKTRGAIATLLVQNGTLKKGDVVLCGESYGKVRALLDSTGSRVNEAGPSSAVQVMGLNLVPVAGDEFEIVKSLDEAREEAEKCSEAKREARLAAIAGEGKLTLASLANAVSSGKEGGVESHQLNVILKVDVQGSVEATREALQVLPQDTVQLRFLMQAPGDIHGSDVDLAVASEAIIIGFNVGIQPGVQAQIEKEGVEVRSYKVIYDLVDDMRQAMEGLLQPIEEQVSIGKAEVRAVFSSGSGKVAGCIVSEGKLVKDCGIKVSRGKASIYTGSLSSLRRVKELAKEVNAGLECGVGVDGFDDWQEGDIIEAFNMVAKKKTLEDASADVTATLSANC